MPIRFKWNPRKASDNEAKHGVSFREAATVLGDPLSVTVGDIGHSGGEDRFVTVGTSIQGRVFVLVHTDRGETTRIISARKATRRERRQYEQGA